MIAIGVLGIGLLMVAATFPVGIDQARIVAEQTTAPIVADEAFRQLSLLMDAPRSLRYRDPADPTKFLAPSVAPPLTLREALRATPVVMGRFNPVFCSDLVSSADPTIKRDINDWLGSPQPALGDANDKLGPGVRRYPSSDIPSGTAAANMPFTWCALYRKIPSPSGGTSVQFVVLVLRRNAARPVLMSARQDGDVLRLPADAVPVVSGGRQYTPADFSEGGWIIGREPVRPADAVVYRVKEVSSDASLLLIDRQGAWDPGDADSSLRAVPREFWIMPVEVLTGRSPLIGVYTRTFPL